jgi:hypothetical protein
MTWWLWLFAGIGLLVVGYALGLIYAHHMMQRGQSPFYERPYAQNPKPPNRLPHHTTPYPHPYRRLVANKAHSKTQLFPKSLKDTRPQIYQLHYLQAETRTKTHDPLER